MNAIEKKWTQLAKANLEGRTIRVIYTETLTYELRIDSDLFDKLREAELNGTEETLGWWVGEHPEETEVVAWSDISVREVNYV